LFLGPAYRFGGNAASRRDPGREHGARSHEGEHDADEMSGQQHA
jgi:hypothetical protein